MWMMGCNEQGSHEQFNIASDCFSSRKLRTLIPRPLPCPNQNPNPHNSFTRFKPTDFLHLINHQLGNPGDENQGRDEMNNNNGRQQTAVSSRWNPTPEQLRTLEEMYRRGTRTPSADQIQHITAQLRRFGKIEGKNVFYWFQNHKARERQKRRRQLDSQTSCMKDDSGSSAEQTKNWTAISNCSSPAEESVPASRAEKAAMADPYRSDRWVQFNDGEMQTYQRRNFMGRNDRWHMTNLSPATAASRHLLYNLPKPTIAVVDITSETFATDTGNTVSGPNGDIKVMDPQELKFFGGDDVQEDGSNGESQTLQLFPLRSETHDSISDKDADMSSGAENINANSFNPSRQFYEFLPLKN